MREQRGQVETCSADGVTVTVTRDGHGGHTSLTCAHGTHARLRAHHACQRAEQPTPLNIAAARKESRDDRSR